MNAAAGKKHALLAAAAAGCALSAYTVGFASSGPMGAFHLALFAWTCLPYAVALLMPRLRIATRASALGYALAALAGDLFMHYLVFIAPKGSTAALGLLFMPLWNLLLLGPIGALLVWGVNRRQRLDPGAS
jgi:hypothetical protein